MKRGASASQRLQQEPVFIRMKPETSVAQVERARATSCGIDGTISACCCLVPRMDGVPAGESGCVIGEPPCDFVVHLAQRLGIDREMAQATLREWLRQYDPQARLAREIKLATGA
jgi:hypothetical protein